MMTVNESASTAPIAQFAFEDVRFVGVLFVCYKFASASSLSKKESHCEGGEEHMFRIVSRNRPPVHGKDVVPILE